MLRTAISLYLLTLMVNGSIYIKRGALGDTFKGLKCYGHYSVNNGISCECGDGKTFGSKHNEKPQCLKENSIKKQTGCKLQFIELEAERSHVNYQQKFTINCIIQRIDHVEIWDYDETKKIGVWKKTWNNELKSHIKQNSKTKNQIDIECGTGNWNSLLLYISVTCENPERGTEKDCVLVKIYGKEREYPLPLTNLLGNDHVTNYQIPTNSTVEPTITTNKSAQTGTQTETQTGTQIGVTIAVSVLTTALLILLILVILYCIKRRKTKQEDNEQNNLTTNEHEQLTVQINNSQEQTANRKCNNSQNENKESSNKLDLNVHYNEHPEEEIESFPLLSNDYEYVSHNEIENQDHHICSKTSKDKQSSANENTDNAYEYVTKKQANQTDNLYHCIENTEILTSKRPADYPYEYARDTEIRRDIMQKFDNYKPSEDQYDYAVHDDILKNNATKNDTTKNTNIYKPPDYPYDYARDMEIPNNNFQNCIDTELDSNVNPYEYIKHCDNKDKIQDHNIEDKIQDHDIDKTENSEQNSYSQESSDSQKEINLNDKKTLPMEMDDDYNDTTKRDDDYYSTPISKIYEPAEEYAKVNKSTHK